MKLLVTGSEGFIGKNLCAHIEAAALGEAFRFDKATDPAMLDIFCRTCDFVFHLAGINRPQDEAGFEENVSFTEQLLQSLERQGRSVPVLMSSSIQARLDNPYGRSKKRAEALVFAYAERNGAKAYVYRLPGIFGKWCAPNYNSVVATFCYNTARNLPLRVNDPEAEIELAYIDDVLAAFTGALHGIVKQPEEYCLIPVTYHVSVGRLAEIISAFGNRGGLFVPDMGDALIRELFSTYLCYLPEDGLAQPLVAHRDARGFFAECVKSTAGGQLSVNSANPGVKKGGHWHHTKAEKFIVISGEGLIRLKKLGGDRVLKYPVSAERLEAVIIPPGYIHEVVNTGTSEMIMLIWCSEVFDPQRPDTYAARLD